MRTLSLVSLLLFSILISCVKTNTNKKGENKIKVAVFDGNGASPVCVTETYEALKIDTGMAGSLISAREISEGRLNDFDVIIFPGGSASKELNNLGESAAEKVVEFVKAGHGAVGICAGGYLFSTTKGYPSLQLVSATEWDRAHYDKGRALVEFKLTKKGRELLPELSGKRCFLQYYDGPVLMPSDSGKSNTLKYIEYAEYVTDIKIHKGYPSDITPGKTFLLGEKVGNGRAIVVAGHPEATPGMRWIVSRLARWAANKPTVRYNKKWIRPELYSSEILYTPDMVKKEKEYFWELFSKDTERKINAMQRLWGMHSRPAVRWNMGLLRDTSPRVRAKAALLLKQAGYSAALPDLQTALKNETNNRTEAVIKETISYLSTY